MEKVHIPQVILETYLVKVSLFSTIVDLCASLNMRLVDLQVFRGRWTSQGGNKTDRIVNKKALSNSTTPATKLEIGNQQSLSML